MNSLETLKTMRDDFENTHHWLTEKYRCESAVAAMENRMIAYAERLRVAREERLEDLRKNGPRAYIEGGVKQLVLLRGEKEEYHDFTERHVMVVYCENESDRKKYGLTKDPPEKDGTTHFVLVTPQDYGFLQYGIRISKEEATTIKKRWREAVEAYEERLYASADEGEVK